jgi:microcystin degradation protein MlrC
MGDAVTRLAVLGLNHETNSFSPVPTGLRAFEQDGVLRGAEIVARHATAHTTVAGLLSVASDDVEVVPLLYASATPSGIIPDDAFETLAGEMLALLAAGAPWDGVLLGLHGAAVTARHPDVDGEILRRVRAVVGPGTPVGAALDMHANVSALMAAHADVLVAFRTNPHVDARETGAECARLVVDAARGVSRPVVAVELVPAVINIVRQSTRESPMRELVGRALARRAEPGVLSVSVVEGYPYADVPEMGMSAVVVADGDRGLADRVAREVGGLIWDARRHFDRPIPGPREAMRAALARPDGPVVLLDVGDNVGGGGSGDSTTLLRVGLAEGALTLEVGGRVAPPPVAVTGTVRTLSDGRYEEPTATHGGFRFFDAGPTAVLALPEDNLVVLTTVPVLPTSLRQLTALGIDPTTRRILVAKGVVSPRAAYEPIASEMILVDTPGVTAADLRQFAYHQRRTPLFPFERDVRYPIGAMP